MDKRARADTRFWTNRQNGGGQTLAVSHNLFWNWFGGNFGGEIQWGVAHNGSGWDPRSQNHRIFVHLAVRSCDANSSELRRSCETSMVPLESYGSALYNKRVSFFVVFTWEKVVVKNAPVTIILTTGTVIRCHANSSELRTTSDLGLAFL